MTGGSAERFGSRTRSALRLICAIELSSLSTKK